MVGLLLKASICATLALYTDGGLPSTGEQCGKICDSIRAEISSSDACAKSRKSLPRPKIGRVCQEGFDEAFALSCGELCSLHGTSRAIPNHQGEACDKRKREVPRPVAHKACVDGFNAGVASTTALVTQRIESLEEATRKSLLAGNAATLKEADAERDTVAEVGRGREAEQEEQRKEEQERARKAVEEKSAQVKREKEALSKKQELETAQAAEQAKREKMKAEEERQARIKAAANAKDETKHAKLDHNRVAGAVESPTSTLEKQAGHATSDRAAAGHEPLNSDQGDEPRDGAGAEEDAATRTDGAPFEEGRTSERIGALDAGGVAAELVETVPVPAGEEKGENSDDANASRLVEMPEDGRSHEMPIADEVQGSRPKTPGDLEDDPRDGAGSEEDATTRTDGAPPGEGKHTLESIGALDAGGVVGLVETVPAPANEESGGNTDDVDASRLIEMPDEGHSQEVPIADQVQGSRPPTPDDGQTNEVRAGDEAPASTAEIDPYARSEDNLATELPTDTRHSEVPTAEHVEGFEDALAPQNDGEALDKLDGAEATENDQDQGDVPKNELTIGLPNDPRYREVLMAEHVEGYEASLGRLDGGQPFDAPVAATEREQEPDSEDSSFVETQHSVAVG